MLLGAGVKWEASTMSHGNRNSKRKGRNDIGSRWGVVAGERRVRSGRWSAERYSDGEHGSYSLYEEEISDVSLSTFYRTRWGVGACS